MAIIEKLVVKFSDGRSLELRGDAVKDNIPSFLINHFISILEGRVATKVTINE